MLSIHFHDNSNVSMKNKLYLKVRTAQFVDVLQSYLAGLIN